MAPKHHESDTEQQVKAVKTLIKGTHVWRVFLTLAVAWAGEHENLPETLGGTRGRKQTVENTVLAEKKEIDDLKNALAITQKDVVDIKTNVSFIYGALKFSYGQAKLALPRGDGAATTGD